MNTEVITINISHSLVWWRNSRVFPNVPVRLAKLGTCLDVLWSKLWTITYWYKHHCGRLYYSIKYPIDVNTFLDNLIYLQYLFEVTGRHKISVK